MKIWNPLHLFAAPPPPEAGKTPTSKQLLEGTAVDALAEALTSIPDPDQVLEQAGMNRADLRRMEYDDEVATALETRVSAVQSTPWRIDPGEGEMSDWLWAEIEPHMESIINCAWAAVPYGYSVMEVIYRQTEAGRIGIGRIEERPFEWFAPMPGGILRYFPSTGGNIDVDTTFKFMLTTRKATASNPYGQALLSRLFAAFVLRQAGWKFWPQFLERFGAPLLIGKTTGSTKELAAVLAAALQSAVVAVDKDDEVDVTASQGTGEAFDRFEGAVAKRIQKVILGQTLTTDVGKTGSYAAAKVHDGVRDDRRQTDIRMVTNTAQRIINALVELNWPGTTEVPSIIIGDGAGIQAERAERDAKLAQAGIARFTDAYLMRAYDFEKGDFEIPEQPAKGSGEPPPASGKASLSAALTAAGFGAPQAPKFTPTQQALEDLADEALAAAASPIDPGDIAAALKAASDPTDLVARLAAIYEGADPVEFRDIAERALFAADLMGYVHDAEQADV